VEGDGVPSHKKKKYLGYGGERMGREDNRGRGGTRVLTTMRRKISIVKGKEGGSSTGGGDCEGKEQPPPNE